MKRNFVLVALTSTLRSIRETWTIFWKSLAAVFELAFKTLSHIGHFSQRAILFIHKSLRSVLVYTFALSSFTLIVSLPVLFYLDPFGFWPFLASTAGERLALTTRFATLGFLTFFSVLFLYNFGRTTVLNIKSGSALELEGSRSGFTYLLSSFVAWLIIGAFLSYLVLARGIILLGIFLPPPALAQVEDFIDRAIFAPVGEIVGMDLADILGQKALDQGELKGRGIDGSPSAFSLRIEHRANRTYANYFLLNDTFSVVYESCRYRASVSVAAQNIASASVTLTSGKNCPMPTKYEIERRENDFLLKWYQTSKGPYLISFPF